MVQLTEQQKYQLSELLPETPISKPFYEKEIVVTETLMAGTTKLTRDFVESVKKHFVFKGNEKFANANIYGTVTIFQPDTIFDSTVQKFVIEKKVVDERRRFYRIWFSPCDLDLITTSLTDVVKNWCAFRNLNIDCDVTQEILQSIKE